MIENTNTYIVYVADGTQKIWSIPFKFLREDEVEIYIQDSTGAKTEVTSDYDIDGDKLTYPVVASALEAGKKLLIKRNTEETQYEDASMKQFTSPDIERMADKLTMIAQEHESKLNRCLEISEFSDRQVLDADAYLDLVDSYIEEASAKATQASESATNAASAATDAAQTAQQAAQIANEAAQSANDATENANAAAQSATDAAQSAIEAGEYAADASQYYAYLESWMEMLDSLKDGDVKTYTAGTSTSTYSGSLTEFPVENEFVCPISVFVNGQYKELTTEYTEDKTNNKITFTTALNNGDKVNIVANVSVADIDVSDTISAAISTHNTDNTAHSTAMAAKEAVANKTATLNSSSTAVQYPTAKVVYDNLVLKQDKSNLVTSISGSSTDAQYPSAKLAYDQLALKQNKTLDTAVTIAGESQTTVQSALTALATADAAKATKDLDNLSSTGEGHFTKKDFSNIQNDAKTVIINAIMPDYANGNKIDDIPSHGAWTKVTKDSFVIICGTDPYGVDVAAWVSPNNDDTNKYQVGYFFNDQTTGFTKGMSFCFLVPKNWYFKANFENAHSAYVYPLKGAQ